MRNKILLIEDDVGLAIPLKDYFEDHGLSVVHTISGEEGLLLYQTKKPDLILLDIILPHKSGFDVISEIRDQDVVTPIILMTGTEFNEENLVKGYSHGTINFMQKPILPQALLLLLQHILSLPTDMQQYQIGNSVIRIHAQQVELDGKQFKIREKDAVLLAFLLQRQNHTVPRSTLLKQIWHDDHPDMNNLLDGAILRIRRIFNDHPHIQINTIYGNGYILTARGIAHS